MDSFWGSLFEQLKDCGRSAAWFLVTLAGMFLLLVVGGIVYANNLQKYVLGVLPVAVVFVVIWLGQVIRRARAYRRHRLQYPPLSRDELRVARSKLTKARSAKRQ